VGCTLFSIFSPLTLLLLDASSLPEFSALFALLPLFSFGARFVVSQGQVTPYLRVSFVCGLSLLLYWNLDGDALKSCLLLSLLAFAFSLPLLQRSMVCISVSPMLVIAKVFLSFPWFLCCFFQNTQHRPSKHNNGYNTNTSYHASSTLFCSSGLIFLAFN